MLTIDELKALNGTNPFYMGLGIIKYRITDSIAYHFYCDQTPTIVDGINEHGWNFKSTIIKGILRNRIYIVDGQDPTSTLQVERGVCTVNSKRVIEVPNANVIELYTFDRAEGESYTLKHDMLHRVETITNKVITMVEMEMPFAQRESRVIIDTTQAPICAFSKPKSVAECWEIIEYTLDTK